MPPEVKPNTAADRLFISYRREASGGYAGRLLDTLAQHLGGGRIFMDTHIAPGENFVDRLHVELATCSAMIVVIAPGWAAVCDAAGPRLAQPDDWVRLEIETAMQAGMLIVPLLVARAELPQPSELPPSLRSFLERQAVELRDASWDDDVRRLLVALDVRPANKAWRYVAAVMTSAILVGLVATIVHKPGPQVAISEDPFQRLTSYSPTQNEQEALVQRFLGQQINVPLLRRFIERARQNALPEKDLHAALETYAQRYSKLHSASVVHELGGTSSDYSLVPKPPCEDTIRLTPSAQLDAAKNQFQDSVQAILAMKRSSDGQRSYAAWCLWLKGQTEMLDLDYAAANSSLNEALKLLANIGDKAVLRYKLLLTMAELARAESRTSSALQFMIEAVAQARPFGKNRQAELMVEIAKLHEEQGQAAPAMEWRVNAQVLYDSELNPGNTDARANADVLAKVYEAAGRHDDAKILRDRYGLSK